MRINQIPTCYFPSTVLFVDDNQDFLSNLTLQLDEDIAFKIHSSPYDALKTIQTSYQKEDINQRILSEHMDTNGHPMTTSAINLDLFSVHWEVYNQHRFNEISVSVVDYEMPGMCGLDFCRKMESSTIKRILLTGKTDERVAIQAFNDGLIDMYIQKQNPNLIQIVNESIKNMQLRYFQSMSDVVVKMLAVTSPICLQDPFFIEFFFNVIKENKIVEYYMTETSGSFLMLNADAELSYLIVKSKQDLRMYYELGLDNKVPQRILEPIIEGKKLPLFWHSVGYSGYQWADPNCLHPANKIEGRDTYYYSFVKNSLSAEVKSANILPFNQFLETF